VTRAWVLEPTGARAIDAPAPSPEPGDVVIAVDAAALTDVDLAVADARRASGAADDRLVAGSSAAGRIVAAGEHAIALIGQRAIVGPHVPCGECDVCRRGGAVVCATGARLGVTARGTLAERVTVPARWIVAFGGDLDVPGPGAALLGGDAALAYALYARVGVGPGEPTVVLGDNVVARFLIEILIAKQAAPIVIVRSNAPAGWRAWVEARARVAAVDHDAPDAEARAAVVAAAHAAGHGDRPWKLFETTGLASRQTRALAIAGPCAIVALAAPGATGHPAQAIELGDALDRDVTVIGVAGAHPDLLVEVAAMAVKGELDVAAACDAVPLAELGAALARRRDARPATGLVASIG
jgi:6-hydroxycyclohex-1-ene-1-carbonyl-CoA dehydrogenase